MKADVLQESGIIFRSAMFWKRPIILKPVALCLLEFPCCQKRYFFFFLWVSYLEICSQQIQMSFERSGTEE